VRLASQPSGNPIEDEFVGQRRIVGMRMDRSGFFRREYLQGDILPFGLQLSVPILYAVGL